MSAQLRIAMTMIVLSALSWAQYTPITSANGGSTVNFVAGTVSQAPNVNVTTTGDPLNLVGTINGLSFGPVPLRTMTDEYADDQDKTGETKLIVDGGGTIIGVNISLKAGLLEGIASDPEKLEDLSQTLLHEAIHAWLAEHSPEFAKDPACRDCRELVTDSLTSSELCAAANDCNAPLNAVDRQALVDGAEEARERCLKKEEANACDPSACMHSPPAGVSTTCPAACTPPNC